MKVLVASAFYPTNDGKKHCTMFIREISIIKWKV